MILSASLLLLGLLFIALFSSQGARNFQLSAILHPAPPYTPSELYAGLRRGDPDTWLAAGLLLLIGLPILRVGLTMVLFLLDQDKTYFLITLFVFVILLSGIFLGKAL
ncbi:DUF1634 domain-containing protein [Candidatus Peregrinibacteria bacterium]|nr:DUF1634 domain-containing protein [Candidatus Peregrinibacteria bacterium]